ncbi:hypothetical protein BJF93_08005 [Xaviernesmea oryzae]|uniref:Type II secretion system protein J n=1 Tax=Xaviernesmea oryzae TaxID=464029 RepID=A0A1Q9AWC0_9HYPH|nr:hypothetical protein BJF93_08005 [Xaviernesmea oryzae]
MSERQGKLPDAGFALIEVLVSLCVVVLISELVLSGITQLKALRRLTQSQEAQIELNSGFDYLENLIENSRKLPLIADDPDNKTLFEGAADTIKFVAVVRVTSSQTGLRDVELRLAKDEKRLDLIQLNRVRRSGAVRDAQKLLVMTDIRYFKIQYLPSEVDSKSTAWLDEWTDRKRAPRALKVELGISRRGGDFSSDRVFEVPSRAGD